MMKILAARGRHRCWSAGRQKVWRFH